MKKNVLALSIATLIGGLGFTGTASAALEVAESGAGHILLVPYYSAQEGNLSVFHLTNTDERNGKAVKVRFRGASNSDDVLDFQVFLSPGDVWTGIVSKNPESGKANLLTVDNSCTIPALPAAGQDFITTRLSRSGWTEADKANETLEGYVEILNMADIPDLDNPPSAQGNRGPNGTNGLFNAIKHNAAGTPTCASNVLLATTQLDRDVTAGWSGAATDEYRLNLGELETDRNAAADLTRPTGGLAGQWYIMNLEQNTTFSGVMHAVSATGTTNNVFSPQMEERATLASADPLMAGSWGEAAATGFPKVRAQKYDVPDLSTAYEVAVGEPTNVVAAAQQAAALTTVLARTAVLNQYATDVELDAKTDWVFSMPTRRYTIAADYTVNNFTAQQQAYRVVNANIPGGNNIFTNRDNSRVNTKGQICALSNETVFWDREERTLTPEQQGPVFSPSTPGTPETYDLCGEVGVLSFQNGTSALGAALTRQDVTAPYVHGWGEVSFNGNVPLLGAAFLKLTNLRVGNGVVANYGVTWTHTYR